MNYYLKKTMIVVGVLLFITLLTFRSAQSVDAMTDGYSFTSGKCDLYEYVYDDDDEDDDDWDDEDWDDDDDYDGYDDNYDDDDDYYDDDDDYYDDDDDWDDDDDDWDDDDDDWDDDDDDWDDEDDYGYYNRIDKEIDFTVDETCYVKVNYTYKPKSIEYDDDDYDYEYISKTGKVRKGYFFAKLLKGDEVIYSVKVSTKGCKCGKQYEGWFFPDEKVTPGEYTLVFSGNGETETDEHYCDATYSVTYEALGYNDYADSASINSKRSVKGGDWVKIGKLGSGLPYCKSIKIGNKKTVSESWMDSDGNIFVYGRKKGKTTVTVTLMNGNTYKTTVTVKAGYPNFMAYVKSYNKKSNCFTVKIKNLGVSNLTIVRKGSNVKDKDFKKYDRKMKSARRVIIKPGKTKYVKFYVKGHKTRSNCKHFVLYSHFKYEGRRYTWKTAYNYTWYKSGKKWYDTYWDFDKYDNWS